MTTWQASAFVGGHPTLDFANTAGGGGKARDVERLTQFADAIEWARAAGVIDDREAGQLATQAYADSSASVPALEELRTQREALHAFLLAAIEGSGAAPASRARVESDIAAAYLAAHLPDRLDDGEVWAVPVAEAGLNVIARRLALATGNLLASDDRKSIRICDRCSWMFLDPSPTKRRRWCSMGTCGNRAKARRHYRREGP